MNMIFLILGKDPFTFKMIPKTIKCECEFCDYTFKANTNFLNKHYCPKCKSSKDVIELD